MLAVKISQAGRDDIDRHALATGVSRSEWTRMALGIALAEPERVAAALRKRSATAEAS